MRRTTNLHQILQLAWTVLCRNYLDDSEGCSYEQLVIGSFITTTRLLMYQVSRRVFRWNIKSPRWLSPSTAQIWQPAISGFSQNYKTKITFENEEISEHQWDSGKWKYDGPADGYRENWVRSHGAYFEGDWGITVPCTMFLVSSSINVSLFHITWLDTFWTDLIYQKEMKQVPWTDSCTSMFIVASFTIANTQKQSKCLPMDEWVKKMWYTYTHIHTHRNIFLPLNKRKSCRLW